MTTVYLLSHERDLDGADEVKVIGVYASENDAREARQRAASLPGFLDHEDGFSIDAYVVGEDHWAEGFDTAPTRSSRRKVA